ncbi:Arogenate dehydratase/prephenate dehydratase 1, chloroplastic, partial [Glycine soja]
LMALKDCSIWGCANKAPQLGFATFQPSSSRPSVNLKHGLEKFCKWECCCLRVLSPRALTPIEDEKHVVAGVDESSLNDDVVEVQLSELEGPHKDVNLLTKPLMANEFSSSDGGAKLRVAYKGLPGAYTEDAVLKAYPKCETVPCEDFETSFKAVESWLVDKAVLPIENSVGGSIHRNYDLLLGHKLHIVGEVQLLINHCLLGLAGVRKEDLKAVMSHPQALVQCKKMLTDLGIAKISVDDTAAAAKAVLLKGRKDIGAIAGSRAANMYGLDVLAEGIQDDDVNITRFLILARDPRIPGNDRPYKTSIVFSLDEGPGVLFKALGAFALRNINLSKIESRPLKQSPLRIVEDLIDERAKYFEYLFYIDFEASMADPQAQYALENLQEYTKFIRVLGCYPVDKTDTSD